MTLTNGRPNLPPMFASVLDAEDAKRERHVAEDASALDREAVSFVKYDPATGAIMESGQMGFGHVWGLIHDGQPYLSAPELSREDTTLAITTHYVDLETKSVLPKEPFPGSVSDTTATELPVPCRIGIQTPFTADRGWWEPVWYDWDEPHVVLSFENPGTYRVTFASVRYRDGVFEVTSG
jgi:hypothetical protein